jgi:uncharacterized protein YjbI with pentapeptide repeats
MKIVFATDKSLEIPYNSLVAVNLNGLNLHRALLENKDIHDSSFLNTDLRGAFLANSNFSNCDFSEASLITAYLINSIIKNANLQRCKAFGCNFSGADLRNASLNDAEVNGADFSYCRLQGSTMTCKGINMALLQDVVYDDSTIWPQNFDPDKAGCLKVHSFHSSMLFSAVWLLTIVNNK